MKAAQNPGSVGARAETLPSVGWYARHREGLPEALLSSPKVTAPEDAMEGIAITAAAAARIREIAARDGISPDDQFLRVAVVSGGCSGLTYDLGWDSALQEKDRVVEDGDFRVVMDLKSFLYLDGTTLDFSDGLDGQGFHFHNPQAARTCACGESFSL